MTDLILAFMLIMMAVITQAVVDIRRELLNRKDKTDGE